MIFLFILGSALLLSLGIEAQKEAWIAVLLGMIGGFFLFLVYYNLYRYNPDVLPTTYMQKIIGTFFGKILAFLYIIYFLYLSSRVLRDFGEMLIISAYPETPLFFMNTLLILVIIYAVHKGIEVIARTGEIILAIAGFISVLISGLIDINHLRPLLDKGFGQVLQTVFTETWYVPFGEVIVFTMIMPYVNKSKKVKNAGLSAMALSGVNLVITMVVNVSVLGIDLATRSMFPLLTIGPGSRIS